MSDPRSTEARRARSAAPLVHKFGGAAVADGPGILRAVGLVSAGDRPAVVVVSALAGVTDAVLHAAREAAEGRSEPIAPTALMLAERYRGAARTVVPARAERQPLLERIESSWEEFSALARGLLALRELTPRSHDYLLARGEELSARLFAAALEARGVPARFVSALEVVKTDGRFGSASPDLARTDHAARRTLAPLLREGVVPVVPGFTGAAPDGRVATLGRGGSDLTATLLGRSLAARAVYLWKDVPGLLTADPRTVPDARVIPQLHQREAGELAYYGAKVLHPRALIPVAGRRVPVFVRPFADPGSSGTEISTRRTLRRYPVKALSAITGQALLTVAGNGMLGVPGIAARTFGALQREGISVSLISQASSEHSICLSVPADHGARACASLREAFRDEIRRREIDGVEERRDLATLAVVGLGMAGTPGIAARVFSALAQGGVNVVAIAQGSSELNISVVLEAREAARAQRLVHEAFQLSKIGGGGVSADSRTDVVLLGFGQIGRALAGLITHPRNRRVRDLSLVAIMDRGGYVFRPAGLSPAQVLRLLASKAEGRSVGDAPGGKRARPEEALEFFAGHALSQPVLVDATADETGRLLERACASRMDLVLANKRPLSGSSAAAARLREAAEGVGHRLRFEATVGAGLPILDTWRKLVESGDRVLKVEGCLSGTLGFLFTELERGRRFSDALKSAMTRGFTEPDPRDDLSGMDVARKALILGRLLGFPGEPGDVQIEPLLPPEAGRLPLARFLDLLESYDPAWEKRVERAKARGRVLRYVASATARRIRVGLAALDGSSPFFGLRGTDNQVAFTTARYRENPLVIKGSGAGPAVTAAGVLNDILGLAQR